MDRAAGEQEFASHLNTQSQAATAGENVGGRDNFT